VSSNRVKLIFRKSKDDGNRLQLCDHQHWVGVGCVNYVARINQAEADSALNRRSDVTVGQLQLGIVDRGLVGANCTFQLVSRG
jgi:hypothetical protein